MIRTMAKDDGKGQGGHNKNNNAMKMTMIMRHDGDYNNDDTDNNWEEEKDLKPAALDNNALLTQRQIDDEALRNVSGYISGYDGFHIGEIQESLRRSMADYDRGSANPPGYQSISVCP